MQKLADTSALAFQQTVYKSEGGIFSQYFHAATPTSALAEMNLGSRPAKRKAAGGTASSCATAARRRRGGGGGGRLPTAVD